MKTTLKALLLFLITTVCALALADPPGRVGRISNAQGEVYFRNLVNGESGPAELNWPVTSQNTISTERGARAELRVGSAAVRIAPDSELEITLLDDKHFKLYLARGSVSIHIRNRDMAQDFELETPQGHILLSEPARIRVDAERAPRTTAVSVWSGSIRFEGTDSNLTVRAGKRAEFADGDIRMSELRGNQGLDDFDIWVQARDQRDDQSISTRYVSAETTGYEELDEHGVWQETSEYGAVWYPRTLPTDWAPYRTGRWTWIEPWGWTWVDSSPWGYAPSHYGRWVLHRNRWCWAPGTVTHRPVWAPALVGWVGGSNWSVSFSAGSAPAIGWFPLAPREIYVPSYHVSPSYVQQINVTHVTNITNVTAANLPPVNYHNRFARNALTVVPQERFTTGRMVVVKGAPAVTSHANHLQAAPLSPVVPAAIARMHAMTATPSSSAPLVTPREHRRRPENAPFPAPIPAPQQAMVPAPAPVQVAPMMAPHRTDNYRAARPEERVAPKIIHPQHAKPAQPQITTQPAIQERHEGRKLGLGPTPRDAVEYRMALPQQQPQTHPPKQHPQQQLQQPVENRNNRQEQRAEPQPASRPEPGRRFMPHHPEKDGR